MFYLKRTKVSVDRLRNSGIVFECVLQNRAPRTANVISQEYELWLAKEVSGGPAEFLGEAGSLYRVGKRGPKAEIESNPLPEIRTANKALLKRDGGFLGRGFEDVRAGRAAQRQRNFFAFDTNGNFVLCASQGKANAFLTGEQRPLR